MICLYLYQYLLLWDTSYIIGNHLMTTFQCKFNHVNQFSCSWDISRWSFYSYWWPDILVVYCYFCTFHIYTDSPHLGLSSATWFVKISLLVVKIQAEWSLWHIQPLGINHIQLGMFYAIVCINLNITRKNHGTIKQITSWFLQGLLQQMISLALIPSSISTIKMTTKWIATNVLIGKTVSTKNGMV